MSKLRLGRISKVGKNPSKVARVSLGKVIKEVTDKILGSENNIDDDYMDAEYEVLEAPKRLFK